MSSVQTARSPLPGKSPSGEVVRKGFLSARGSIRQPKNLLLRDITLCEKGRGRISTRLVGWGSLSSSGSPVFATHNATHNRRDLHVLRRTYAAVRDLQVVEGRG